MAPVPIRNYAGAVVSTSDSTCRQCWLKHYSVDRIAYFFMDPCIFSRMKPAHEAGIAGMLNCEIVVNVSNFYCVQLGDSFPSV